MSAHNNFLDFSESLFAEAERQLNICSSCRYCEGYCAVFPSLESRTPLTRGDVAHLANLCHDCRDCFYACMYSPPHSFAVNPPQIFSEIRRATYDGGLGNFPQRAPSGLRGWRGALSGVAVSAMVLMGTVLCKAGVRPPLGQRATPTSPYSVLPYVAILIFALAPFVWSVLMMVRSARRYWIDIQGSVKNHFSYKPLLQAVSYATDLRYLKGGGAECAYPGEEMSPARRRLHAATAYGFVALLFSTMSAAVFQDLFDTNPPYPILSIPVGLGIIGGTSMVLGCTGLIILKGRVEPASSDAQMIIRDYGLLIALDLLGITGLLTLALRSTSFFGIILVIHLALVLASFAIAPYTKFVHFIYRFLSILKDNLEHAANNFGA